MEKKEPFGSQYAETFDVGDIVAWSTWCSNSNSYIDHTGILISINDEIIGEIFLNCAVKLSLLGSSK